MVVCLSFLIETFCMLVVSMLLISNILPQRKQIFVFFQMTEEDLAAQMEADRLLQATLRAQVRHIFFLKIQNILASL